MKTWFLVILFHVVAIQYTQAIKCFVCQNCTIPTKNHSKECPSEDHDQCKVEIVEMRVNRMCHEDMRQGLGCKDKTEQCLCDSDKCNDNKELKEHFCSKKEQFGEDFKKNFPSICEDPSSICEEEEGSGVPDPSCGLPDPSDSGDSGDSGAVDGLPTAAIIGIVVGVIVVALVVVAAVAFMLKRKQNDPKTGDKSEEDAGTNLLVIENGEKKDESKSENIDEKKGDENPTDNDEKKE